MDEMKDNMIQAENEEVNTLKMIYHNQKHICTYIFQDCGQKMYFNNIN